MKRSIALEERSYVCVPYVSHEKDNRVFLHALDGLYERRYCLTVVTRGEAMLFLLSASGRGRQPQRPIKWRQIMKKKATKGKE